MWGRGEFFSHRPGWASNLTPFLSRKYSQLNYNSSPYGSDNEESWYNRCLCIDCHWSSRPTVPSRFCVMTATCLTRGFYFHGEDFIGVNSSWNLFVETSRCINWWPLRPRLTMTLHSVGSALVCFASVVFCRLQGLPFLNDCFMAMGTCHAVMEDCLVIDLLAYYFHFVTTYTWTVRLAIVECS